MAQPVDGKAYYGYLFQHTQKPTKVLDALLRGIANYISISIGDTREKTLTPDKLARFYKAVGGNYDSLFVDVPYPSISWIYASIGCQHTLQPDSNVFNPPFIPALTAMGYVSWQSIEILLGPEEHVPFMQYAVQNFEILHPETGERFPADLPTEAFPAVPDPMIVEWHAQCAEKLRRRVISDRREDRPDLPPRPRVHVEIPQKPYSSKTRPFHDRSKLASYFDTRTNQIRRDIPFAHVHGTGIPRAEDRPVRPKLSSSPTHRAREFMAPEFLSPGSPRLSRSRHHSVPDNMNSPSPPHSHGPLSTPNAEYIRRHSHPRQRRRGSESSDASSERDELPSPPQSQSPHQPPRKDDPSIRFQSPMVSPQSPPTVSDSRPHPRRAHVSDVLDEELRTKYSLPIDKSGRLSAPFLLSKRDSERPPRNGSKGGNVRWHDLTDGRKVWRNSSERSSGEERDVQPRRRRISRDIDRDIDRDRDSRGAGSMSDHKIHEPGSTFQPPTRHSSQDDSTREREWDAGTGSRRYRERDRKFRPVSPTRGVDGRIYPTAR
ncbi:hypothetical protein BJ878DRAFT_510966 [Calycina marina]|uniref:DUF7514 domain-containing protein n=1 Tax=Calycina marina TaxID=1763456 RepID=A0A9P8CDU7_9HELO|nr:hypothetical protein BJ878DRAFT_510966 [Calycina marina]